MALVFAPSRVLYRNSWKQILRRASGHWATRGDDRFKRAAQKQMRDGIHARPHLMETRGLVKNDTEPRKEFVIFEWYWVHDPPRGLTRVLPINSAEATN
jgi:hypothetical protein